MSICNLDHFAESYWEPRRHVLVGGCFDPLHEGHLRYFEEARRLGPLVCAVAPHAEVARKRTPCLPELTRLKVLNACSLVEHVHLATQGMPAVIEALKPLAYAVGEDWQSNLPPAEAAACVRAGTMPTYLVGYRENSSTGLLADYERRRNAEKLAAFETFVQQQTPADKPWQPVTDYSFEARKAIEGPHAQIIKDAFQPLEVLDVGCGPGHLVRMLRVAGVFHVCGIDSAAHADQTDEQISQHDIASLDADHADFRPRHDLVICREVLEHLTVRQLAIAVRNLVKLSSKYVYVTTRFSPDPHLLDVAGADDLDPTHVSMLNQDYLRSLFVLEGCRRRADLEVKLDWQQKGRVLVYEVPA